MQGDDGDTPQQATQPAQAAGGNAPFGGGRPAKSSRARSGQRGVRPPPKDLAAAETEANALIDLMDQLLDDPTTPVEHLLEGCVEMREAAADLPGPVYKAIRDQMTRLRGEAMARVNREQTNVRAGAGAANDKTVIGAKGYLPRGKMGKITRVQYVLGGTTAGVNKYGATARTATSKQLLRRGVDGYTGDGAYWGNWLGQRIPYVGGAAAGMALSAAEDWAMDRGMNYLKKYRGQGDYKTVEDGGEMEMEARPQPAGYDADPNGPNVKYNQLINPGTRTSRKQPTFSTVGDETGDVRFVHREYLMDLTPTSADFQTQIHLELNAGLEKSFPLLSKFARYFSEYRFEQLIVGFTSLVTGGNANAAGSIMFATKMNPSHAEHTSKRGLEAADGSVSGKVTDDIRCGIECNPKKIATGGYLYTRTKALTQADHEVGLDLNTYDLGFTQIATAGCVPGLTLGEIFVEYSVRLSKLSNTENVGEMSADERAEMDAAVAAAVESAQAAAYVQTQAQLAAAVAQEQAHCNTLLIAQATAAQAAQAAAVAEQLRIDSLSAEQQVAAQREADAAALVEAVSDAVEVANATLNVNEGIAFSSMFLQPISLAAASIAWFGIAANTGLPLGAAPYPANTWKRVGVAGTPYSHNDPAAVITSAGTLAIGSWTGADAVIQSFYDIGNSVGSRCTFRFRGVGGARYSFVMTYPVESGDVLDDVHAPGILGGLDFVSTMDASTVPISIQPAGAGPFRILAPSGLDATGVADDAEYISSTTTPHGFYLARSYCYIDVPHDGIVDLQVTTVFANFDNSASWTTRGTNYCLNRVL